MQTEVSSNSGAILSIILLAELNTRTLQILKHGLKLKPSLPPSAQASLYFGTIAN